MKPVINEMLLPFEGTNTHRVAVTVYRTRRSMVRAMKRAGHKEASEAEASCWQYNHVTFVDGRIAHMHFCLDRLTAGTIAHECLHAAYHRLRLVGVPPVHQDYEERLATETGNLVDSIMHILRVQKIPVMA